MLFVRLNSQWSHNSRKNKIGKKKQIKDFISDPQKTCSYFFFFFELHFKIICTFYYHYMFTHIKIPSENETLDMHRFYPVGGSNLRYDFLCWTNPIGDNMKTSNHMSPNSLIYLRYGECNSIISK